MFTLEERIKRVTGGFSNVEVDTWDGLFAGEKLSSPAVKVWR
jgi:hypothetical protein